jgi:hypothetical protein
MLSDSSGRFLKDLVRYPVSSHDTAQPIPSINIRRQSLAGSDGEPVKTDPGFGN